MLVSIRSCCASVSLRYIRLFAWLSYCLCMVQHVTSAQDGPSYGVSGAYAVNKHVADFRAFPGVPSCCPSYQDGSGSDIAIAAMGRLPLGGLFRGDLRLGYAGLSGVLTRTEQLMVAGGIPGKFEHRVEAALAAATIEPSLAARVFGDGYVYVGARLGVLLGQTFSQKETIVEPLSGTFPNGKRSQNELVDVPIPDAARLQAALTAGLQWELPLNRSRSMLLVPEVSYAFAPTSLAGGVSWNVHQMRIGASLVFTTGERPVRRRLLEERIVDTVRLVATSAVGGLTTGIEDVDDTETTVGGDIVTYRTIRRTDTLRVTTWNAFTASVAAKVVLADGREEDVTRIQLEEFASTLMTPLLPYVFFDEARSSVDDRYAQLRSSDVANFSVERVNSADKLKVYYQLLNIVGHRMRGNAAATITLVGCNADIAQESGNTDLSLQRAQAVRSYLVNTWGIAEGRIRVEARNLPEKHANPETADGAQENRRVEILADDTSILAPVLTSETLRTATPPGIRLRSRVEGANTLDDWTVELVQDQQVLKTFKGKGAMPQALDWDVNGDRNALPKAERPITYRISVRDASGRTSESRQQIAVRQVTLTEKRTEGLADKEINRFSLLLFDVRSEEISPASKMLVDQIKGYIKPTSVVHITGWTDRLGSAEGNQSLAEARARNTAKALGLSFNPQTMRGVGNASSYAPTLPEGRMYTRSVDIVVEHQLTR